jgi:transcriptional regulator of arginine metabolism
MNKSFRHGRILKLIRSRAIHTQDELAHALVRLGVKTSQVTLSRDIRELGLVKTPGGYRQIAPEHSGPNLPAVAREFLLDVKTAQNLVVLKTSPAHASSVAVALDQDEWPDVTGTVAGDDTVLVVCPDPAAARKVRSRLLALLA